MKQCTGGEAVPCSAQEVKPCHEAGAWAAERSMELDLRFSPMSLGCGSSTVHNLDHLSMVLVLNSLSHSLNTSLRQAMTASAISHSSIDRLSSTQVYMYTGKQKRLVEVNPQQAFNHAR